MKFLGDTDDPDFRGSGTVDGGLKHDMLWSGVGGSEWTGSSNSAGETERIKPNIGNELSTHPGFREEVKEPVFTKLSTGGKLPNCVGLRVGIAGPTCERFETAEVNARRALPGTEDATATRANCREGSGKPA